MESNLRERVDMETPSGVTLAEVHEKVRDVIVGGVVPRIWIHCLKEPVTPGFQRAIYYLLLLQLDS